MVDFARLEGLMDGGAAAALANWREINKEISDQFGVAQSEIARVALLAAFKATMDLAETTVAPKDLHMFREARTRQYTAFITMEALVAGSVCVDTLDAVTRREIAAGRLAPDSELRRIAECGMAVPHLSRVQLIERANTSQRTSVLQRVVGWFGRD